MNILLNIMFSSNRVEPEDYPSACQWEYYPKLFLNENKIYGKKLVEKSIRWNYVKNTSTSKPIKNLWYTKWYHSNSSSKTPENIISFIFQKMSSEQEDWKPHWKSEKNRITAHNQQTYYLRALQWFLIGTKRIITRWQVLAKKLF